MTTKDEPIHPLSLYPISTTSQEPTMAISGIQTEVIPLSELVAHNGLDLESVKEEIDFNGNMCHLSDIKEYLQNDDLDADGREDDVLVNLWA